MSVRLPSGVAVLGGCFAVVVDTPLANPKSQTEVYLPTFDRDGPAGRTAEGDAAWD